MCGRFSFVASQEKIQSQLGLDFETGGNLRFNFNIAPTQQAYVVTNENPKRLDYLTWGLIPGWSNDGKNSGQLINARSEGIETKPSFRVPIRKKRCLVLADSFYEWKHQGTDKTPFRILLKNGNLMLMAGIWDTWVKGDYVIKSFSILTCPPNEEMTGIHNRMPVILNRPADQQKWLSDLALENVLQMLGTPEDGILEMYPVSSKVNSVKNNSPDLHQRIGDTPTLF